MILRYIVKINILINFFPKYMFFLYIFVRKETQLKNFEKTILNDSNHYKNIKMPYWEIYNLEIHVQYFMIVFFCTKSIKILIIKYVN